MYKKLLYVAIMFSIIIIAPVHAMKRKTELTPENTPLVKKNRSQKIYQSDDLPIKLINMLREIEGEKSVKKELEMLEGSACLGEYILRYLKSRVKEAINNEKNKKDWDMLLKLLIQARAREPLSYDEQKMIDHAHQEIVVQAKTGNSTIRVCVGMSVKVMKKQLENIPDFIQFAVQDRLFPCGTTYCLEDDYILTENDIQRMQEKPLILCNLVKEVHHRDGSTTCFAEYYPGTLKFEPLGPSYKFKVFFPDDLREGPKGLACDSNLEVDMSEATKEEHEHFKKMCPHINPFYIDLGL